MLINSKNGIFLVIILIIKIIFGSSSAQKLVRKSLEKNSIYSEFIEKILNQNFSIA
jgi:hypothetical protein